MPERDLLMIPGPTMVDPAVLRAISAPVRSQAAPEVVEAFGAALEGMRVVLGARAGAPYIIAGSGTLALEFGAANLIEPGDKVLLIDTGVFAYRFQQICERYDAQITVLNAPPGDTISLDAVEAELQKGGYKFVEMVHVDTSTDVQVDVTAVSKLARRYGALVVVDGVCAAAGVEVKCDEWGVDLYMTGSQKAFGVPPGLALCWTSERALDTIRKRRKPVRNFFCDALNWLPVMQAMEARKVAYFATPPVNMICGLHESLKQILAETMEKRVRRHAILSRAFKAGLDAMGLRQVPLRPEIAAPTLSCAYFPPGVDGSMIQHVRAHGVTIAMGIHPRLKPYFRVGHMGTVMPNDILATLGAIESALLVAEHELQPGAGLSAAMRVLVEM
ncbi:MAG: alanine--glyoxylate aminotransferase family protein [Chloroflexi bacterium]|nr:alanine--glyoxylate aminotransferase family protein [Chloroflexota bacterium]